MNHNEEQYLGILTNVLNNGFESDDRTDTGTLKLFNQKGTYNVTEKQLPVITTKKIWFKAITAELCWFLKGMTNIEYLTDRGVTIWDEWADDNGELGPVYGKQLRSFPSPNSESIDQLNKTKHQIQNKPDSRRHVITLWNPGQLEEMRLAPCHGVVIQAHSVKQDNQRTLHLSMYQRSGDMFLGVPFNITSYSLLLLIMAHHTNHKPGLLYHTIGDTHIYLNHVEQVKKQLKRNPKEEPSISINHQEAFEDYEPEHFELENYKHHDKIKAPVAV